MDFKNVLLKRIKKDIQKAKNETDLLDTLMLVIAINGEVLCRDVETVEQKAIYAVTNIIDAVQIIAEKRLEWEIEQ